jgi:hypothetical protein
MQQLKQSIFKTPLSKVFNAWFVILRKISAPQKWIDLSLEKTCWNLFLKRRRWDKDDENA